MSVVVGIKEGKKVYLGADSQVTRGGTRTTLNNPNNYKIWKVDSSKHCLMGHVGNLRDANIVRLMGSVVDDYDEYRNRVDYRFVVKYLVPQIIKNLREANFLKGNDGEYLDFMDSSYLFAYKSHLYVINTDCSVIEINDYVAIGSGASEAIGSLLSTEGEDPKQRIIKAIKSSAANDIYVDYPIILSDTKDTEFEIITEKDEFKYLNKKKDSVEEAEEDLEDDEEDEEEECEEYEAE